LDDPEGFLLAQRQRLVILDEVQRMPELFTVLRGVIDIRRRAGEPAGQFLLLGSASGVLLQQASEMSRMMMAFLARVKFHEFFHSCMQIRSASELRKKQASLIRCYHTHW
jgi:hypothetical protein